MSSISGVNTSSSISSLLNSLSSSTGTSVSDPVADSLNRSSQKLEQQRSQTEVQLSNFGQIKSGFASVQSAGKALASLNKTSSTEDVTKAAQAFVSAYNNTNKAVGSVATVSRGSNANATSSTVVNDSRAHLAGNELRRTLASGNNTAELSKLGISVNKDGSLSVDTKALEKAVKANPEGAAKTLASIGSQAEQTATRQLGSSGNIGKAINSLNTQANTLDSKQAQQQQAAQRSTAFSSNGIGNYQQLLGLGS